MAATIKMEILKQNVISQHVHLIGQLETKYMNYIQQILQKKSQIIQEMQRNFYKELENIHKGFQYNHSDNNLGNIASNPFVKIDTSQLPYLGRSQIDETENNNVNQNISGVTNTLNVMPSIHSLISTQIHQSEQTDSENQSVKSSIDMHSSVTKKDKSQFQTKKSNSKTNVGNINEKKWKCSQCAYATKQKSHLERHINTHSSEKPFKCSQCAYATKDKGNLNRHIKTHSLETPYQCRQCNKAFKTKAYLRKHSVIHSSERPYQCNQCKKAFKTKTNLNSHIKTHSGEKPYQCKYCKKCFALKHYLNRHIQNNSCLHY